MKNISILTLVIVLSACAGGSGGPDGRFQENWSSPYRSVTTRAAESNKKVTSMVSEFTLCEGNCTAHTTRVIGGPSHAHHASYNINGGTVTVYNLEDVTFTMAAASGSGGDENGNKDTLKFKLDKNGRIDAVKHSSNTFNGTEYVQADGASATFQRKSEDEIKWDVEQEDNGEGKHYIGTGTFKTYGKDLELSYSDFGQMEFDLEYTPTDNPEAEPVAEKSYEPFAGGYDKLKHETPGSNMAFTGKAVGSVSNGDYNQSLNGDATLSFDATKEKPEKLQMNFSNGETPWYDVTIEKGASSNSITFTTSDTLNANINESVKFNDFGTGTSRTVSDYLVDGYNGAKYPETPDKTTGKIDIGYYGIGNDIVEATGVTQYVEKGEAVPGTNGEIRMNVGFGMTKNSNN